MEHQCPSTYAGGRRWLFPWSLLARAVQRDRAGQRGPTGRHRGRATGRTARSDFAFPACDVGSSRTRRAEVPSRCTRRPVRLLSSSAQESRCPNPLFRRSQQSSERRGSAHAYPCRPRQAHQMPDARTDSGPESGTRAPLHTNSRARQRAQTSRSTYIESTKVCASGSALAQ